jgi:hypothetical protein
MNGPRAARLHSQLPSMLCALFPSPFNQTEMISRSFKLVAGYSLLFLENDL